MIDLKQVASILLLIWNFFIFILYGIDKYKSKRGHWRIPEKYLLLGAFIFGGFDLVALEPGLEDSFSIIKLENGILKQFGFWEW